MNSTMPFPDSETVSLTPVCETDFEELVALRIESMRPSLEKIGRFDPTRARERFRQGFSAVHTRHIVIEGSRVGFVAVLPQSDGLLLDHLYIRPGFQGRGIGAAVVARIFAEADAANLAVRVGALRDSDANHFYTRHGFQKIDESEWDIYYLRPAKACRSDL